MHALHRKLDGRRRVRGAEEPPLPTVHHGIPGLPVPVHHKPCQRAAHQYTSTPGTPGTPSTPSTPSTAHPREDGTGTISNCTTLRYGVNETVYSIGQTNAGVQCRMTACHRISTRTGHRMRMLVRWNRPGCVLITTTTATMLARPQQFYLFLGGVHKFYKYTPHSKLVSNRI